MEKDWCIELLKSIETGKSVKMSFKEFCWLMFYIELHPMPDPLQWHLVISSEGVEAIKETHEDN